VAALGADGEDKKLTMLRVTMIAKPRNRERRKPQSTPLAQKNPSQLAQQYRLKNTEALRLNT